MLLISKQTVQWNQDFFQWAEDQGYPIAFLAASFWLLHLETSLSGRRPLGWTFRRFLGRNSLKQGLSGYCWDWPAGGPLLGSWKLNPQEILLTCSSSTTCMIGSMETSTTDKTKLKNLDNMILLFWGMMTSTLRDLVWRMQVSVLGLLFKYFKKVTSCINMGGQSGIMKLSLSSEHLKSNCSRVILVTWKKLEPSVNKLLISEVSTITHRGLRPAIPCH